MQLSILFKLRVMQAFGSSQINFFVCLFFFVKFQLNDSDLFRSVLVKSIFGVKTNVSAIIFRYFDMIYLIPRNANVGAYTAT